MNPIAAPARLPLAFKGHRDYLHGSDIFNALIRLTGASSAVSLQIHKLIHHPLYAVPDPPAQPDAEFNGLFEYLQGDRWLPIGLREDPTAAVESRIPYDEDAVTAAARFADRQAISPGPVEATFIERVLALNKRLLNAQFAPLKTKWLFTRLQLDRVPKAVVSITLTLELHVATRLTKTAIDADGDRIGYVYFSQARP